MIYNNVNIYYMQYIQLYEEKIVECISENLIFPTK